jgi:hypothetical protein
MPLRRALLVVALVPSLALAGEQWTKQKAAEWYAKQPWLVGANYIPSTAINQLEMWQAETYDPETIDRELGWAEDLGFNTMRVFLHDIPFRNDQEAFLKRIDHFLGLCEKHKIRPMLVLFDAVWDPYPRPGPQREPKPGVHNSGWVQSPGRAILENRHRHDELKGYVLGVIGRFRDDPRVLAWDIFNEPDNPNASSYGKDEFPDKPRRALELLRDAYDWARSVNPTQPITSGVWQGEDWSDPAKMTPMWRFQLEASDIITYHDYNPLPQHKKRVEALKKYGRPILCTEYMARPRGSTFDPILGYLKEENIGAYNWGFVDGKSQTIYPWETWQQPATGEPDPWFHDIFRRDGTPYRKQEVDYIRRLTGAGRRDPEN